jgi:hypothetical protein
MTITVTTWEDAMYTVRSGLDVVATWVESKDEAVQIAGRYVLAHDVQAEIVDEYGRVTKVRRPAVLTAAELIVWHYEQDILDKIAEVERLRRE